MSKIFIIRVANCEFTRLTRFNIEHKLTNGKKQTSKCKKVKYKKYKESLMRGSIYT